MAGKPLRPGQQVRRHIHITTLDAKLFDKLEAYALHNRRSLASAAAYLIERGLEELELVDMVQPRTLGDAAAWESIRKSQ